MQLDLTRTPRQLLASVRLNGEKACEESRDWLREGKFATASDAWNACPRPDWLLWLLQALGLIDELKNRKFMAWCARNTPLADGRITWDLLTDHRSRAAVELADRMASGEQIGLAAMSAARSAARSASWSAAWSAARSASWSAAWSAARSAAWSAARSASWSAAWSAATLAQANALRAIYGDPFKT